MQQDMLSHLPKKARKTVDTELCVVLSCWCMAIAGIIVYKDHRDDEVVKFMHAVSKGASVTLLGVTYGILNDYLACRSCVEYFYDLHNEYNEVHGRLIETKNPFANGYIWGIHATLFLSCVAGAVFFVVDLGMEYGGKPRAPYILTTMLVLVLFTVGFAHHKAKQRELDLLYEGVSSNNPYTREEMPSYMVAKWYGNGCRNEWGYTLLPIMAFVVLILDIALRSADVRISRNAEFSLYVATMSPVLLLIGGGFVQFTLYYYDVPSNAEMEARQVSTV